MIWILDIGSGHSPSKQANLFLDRHLTEHQDREGRKAIIMENMVIGDALYLPFRTKSIRKVVSNHCIEHTDDPYKFIIECHRVSDNIEITAPGLIHEVIRTLLFDSVEDVHKWVYLPTGKWIPMGAFIKARPEYTKRQRLWIRVMRALPDKVRHDIFGVFSYLLDEYCCNLGVHVIDFRYTR